MEHRDSPEIEPEPTESERLRPGQRFARLVESPISRRVALPRLIIAGGLLLGLVALLWLAITRLIQKITDWVDQRPEHQIPFSQIELVPEPEGWIKGGKALILSQVRREANLDEMVSLLDLDLSKLQTDFKRCVWVKQVVRIDRSNYGRLIVELVYRRPVAEIRYQPVPPGDFILDEEGVVLPDDEIRWTSHLFPYRVHGIPSPLIEIKNIPETSTKPRFGLPWKRRVEDGLVEEPDPLVLRAARLARFLQDRSLALKSPADAPDFVSIYIPRETGQPFFLIDSGQNYVCWGMAPGDDRIGEPSPETRWTMLLQWIKTHGPVIARYPDYLDLRGPEPQFERGPGSSGGSTSR